MRIYIGDGSKIKTRIQSGHCNGNVEGSVLRQHIAICMGYSLKSLRRPNGSKRVRIDLTDPRIGERDVSAYIQAGFWQYVICESVRESKDFQWYAIQQLKPIQNINQGQWNQNRLQRYQELLAYLNNSVLTAYDDIYNIPDQPGVYLLHHENQPPILI